MKQNQTMKSTTNPGNRGQAMIALLFVSAIVIFWSVESAALNLSTLDNSTNLVDGQILLIKSEGYLENSIMQFLRNPLYEGESLQDGSISCTIQVGNSGPNKDIISTCQQGGKQKSTGITVGLSGGVFTFSKITER